MEACAMGACGITCAAGFGNCDKVAANGCEANLGSDVNNCGACGNVCPLASPLCLGGMCAAHPPCNNVGGGAVTHDNGTGRGELYCYNNGDSADTRARKACESHFGIGSCCVIQGGYSSLQWGQCGQGGGGGSIHWHPDTHPNGHCGPFYNVGDVISPGWCGNTLGNYMN